MKVWLSGRPVEGTSMISVELVGRGRRTMSIDVLASVFADDKAWAEVKKHVTRLREESALAAVDTQKCGTCRALVAGEDMDHHMRWHMFQL